MHLISILPRDSRRSNWARQTHRTLQSITSSWANRAFLTLGDGAEGRSDGGRGEGSPDPGHSQKLLSLQQVLEAPEDLVFQEVQQARRYQAGPFHQENP